MKRRFNHWSPRYLTARIQNFLFLKRYPDKPWLTPDAIEFLDQWLRKADHGAEFGSGRSTIWFAKRVSTLLSVENNPDWYNKVKQWLQDENCDHVDYLLAGENENESDLIRASKYVNPAIELPEESLDIAVVDGRWRSQCANALICKLKPGGLLIIDNANLYLPSNSHSPNSQSIDQGPATETWRIFWESTTKWRRFWTSNGVFDTALFFKPGR